MGKLSTWLCTVSFGRKSSKLNSRQVYCSQLYGTWISEEYCQQKNTGQIQIFFNSAKVWWPILSWFLFVLFKLRSWNCSTSSTNQIRNNFLFTTCTNHVNQLSIFNLIEETIDLSLVHHALTKIESFWNACVILKEFQCDFKKALVSLNKTTCLIEMHHECFFSDLICQMNYNCCLHCLLD